MCRYLTIFLCLVVTFRSRFQSEYLAPPPPLLLSGQNGQPCIHKFSLINTLNCLPPLSASTDRGFPSIVMGRYGQIKRTTSNTCAVAIRPLECNGCKTTVVHLSDFYHFSYTDDVFITRRVEIGQSCDLLRKIGLRVL